jgi:tyrosine-protein phosphatase
VDRSQHGMHPHFPKPKMTSNVCPQNFIMQLQEFRSSLARGGLLPENRGLSPITPGSALSEWHGPFSSRSTDAGPPSSTLSVGSARLQRPIPDTDSLPALSPGPSSAPSGMPWPKDHTEQSQRPRALSSTRTSPTYVDPAGHLIPSLNVIEPERPEIKRKVVTVPTFPYREEEATTPTDVVTSPRSTEFAMTSLKPSMAVDSADSFGLMSPTSTEFDSSPFDRSALLAQLGMGSMHQHDNGLARARSLGLRHSPQNSRDESRNLSTPGGKKLRGKVSSPSIREQQELQRLQADIEARLHIEQQQQQPREQPRQSAQRTDNVTLPMFEGFGDALMSPRATEFTENPFAMTLSPPEAAPSTREQQKASDQDPRSPAHKGVSPITRNIGDVL